jgi:uncharacterized protein
MNQQRPTHFSRRETLLGLGAAGAAFCAGGAGEAAGSAFSPGGPNHGSVCPDVHARIDELVQSTTFVDTHEHLLEEAIRFQPADNALVPCDDWSVLVAGYLLSDLISAGLPADGPQWTERHPVLSPDVAPRDKWKMIEPYWPAVRNTGYGLATRESVRHLYGIDEISAATIDAIQDQYERTRVPGFYRRVLCDVAKIESCQVNSFERTFLESSDPTLLMQDIQAIPLLATDPFGDFMENLTREACREPTGITVTSLADWHRVIDWWFDRYGQYAVAVKSPLAYARNIDHERVPVELAEFAFSNLLRGQNLSDKQKKGLEDHLFWYTVKKAGEHQLPIKLHTGYHAGENAMPLSRVINDPASACDLCRAAPEARFVFMHICYPYYEELITVAKQYSNAYIDMCWAWIVNPLAAKDFLKKYLVTAPANKVLTFGADYAFVENVVGHAAIARQGITQSLAELVTDGWMDLDEALYLVPQLMHGNARQIFRLEEKTKLLANAPWI